MWVLLERREVSSGGVILLDTEKDAPYGTHAGVVIGAGPESELDLGDLVLFKPHKLRQYMDGPHLYYLLDSHQVLGVVEEGVTVG